MKVIRTTITLDQKVTDDITTGEVLDYLGDMRDWIKEIIPEDIALVKLNVSVEDEEVDE